MLPRSPLEFEQALQNFEALERSLDLPAWQVNGVYVWKLIRFAVFSAYLELGGLSGPAHPEVQRLKPSKLRVAARFLNLAIKRNPFLSIQRDTQRFIIPDKRKQLRNGIVVDPISYRAWAGSYCQTSLVLDRASPLHPFSISASASYDVISFIGEASGRFRRIKISSRDVQITELIQQALGLRPPRSNFDVLAITVRATKNFLGVRDTFSSLLQKAQPRALYLVVSYGKEAAIAAAKNLGIPTVEFQHGALGRGHMGYDFAGWSCVPYFPEKILAFGPNWFANCSLPEQCAVIPVGAPHIETAVSELFQTKGRHSRQLLVLSQGPVARQLVEQIARFAKLRSDWRILVRPHPSENRDQLRALWDELLGGAGNRVEVENNRSLVEQAVESSVAAGVNSTGLLEALLVGCPVVFLRLPNASPYFEQLVVQGEALAVANGEALAEVVDSARPGSARGYFSESVEDVVRLVEEV